MSQILVKPERRKLPKGQWYCNHPDCPEILNDIACRNRKPRFCKFHQETNNRKRNGISWKKYYRPTIYHKIRYFFKLMPVRPTRRSYVMEKAFLKCRICGDFVPTPRTITCSKLCAKKNHVNLSRASRKRKESRNAI